MERILKQGNIRRRLGIEIMEGKLDYGRRVDDTAISLTETAGASSLRLLADLEDVAFESMKALADFKSPWLAKQTHFAPSLYL